MKIFDHSISSPIKVNKFPNGEPCLIYPLDNTFIYSPDDLNRLVVVCNQKDIYEILFRKKLNSKPYMIENALSLINWGRLGWESNKWFAFLVRDTENKIVASVTIKSNDLESSEIGYWASEDKPGIMTNTVDKICEIAKLVGYKNLYGLVIPDNKKSINVLLRLGFKVIGELDANEKHYLKIAKKL